jgi:hypothetical protein
VKAEYFYVDLGGRTVNDPTNTLLVFSESSQLHEQTVRAGLNYLFNEANGRPASARASWRASVARKACLFAAPFLGGAISQEFRSNGYEDTPAGA